MSSSEFLILQCGLDEQTYLAIGIILGILIGSLFTLIVTRVFKKEKSLNKTGVGE